MFNFLKKIFSIFLIFNLTFVSSAQAAASFVDSFDVSGQDAAPRGLTFNNDGTKMFVVGNADIDINEYTLSCPFKVTATSTCDAPPKIKDVRGIVDAQINTAKNFAKDSSQSALKRLANLRAKDNNKSAQKIELNFQNEILNILAHVEAYIDFPEEDIAPEAIEKIIEKLKIKSILLFRIWSIEALPSIIFLLIIKKENT
mgnify:CR=1 FL=1